LLRPSAILESRLRRLLNDPYHNCSRRDRRRLCRADDTTSQCAIPRSSLACTWTVGKDDGPGANYRSAAKLHGVEGRRACHPYVATWSAVIASVDAQPWVRSRGAPRFLDAECPLGAKEKCQCPRVRRIRCTIRRLSRNGTLRSSRCTIPLAIRRTNHPSH
jgi:hypothetical protein